MPVRVIHFMHHLAVQPPLDDILVPLQGIDVEAIGEIEGRFPLAGPLEVLFFRGRAENMRVHVVGILPFVVHAADVEYVDFGPFLCGALVEPECARCLRFHGAALDLEIAVFYQSLTFDGRRGERVVTLWKIRQGLRTSC